MTVTAHSGAFDTSDNTIENITKVLEEKCDIIEMDVTFRKDGTPVIIHKDKPDDNEGVLLRDAFELVSSNESILLNLDIKSTSNLPAVDALLREYGLFDRAFYTGVFEDWVAVVKENSAVPYYLNLSVKRWRRNSRKTAEKAIEKIKKAGAVGMNVNYSNVTETLVSELHKNNIPISVWTINDEKTAKRFIPLGVDNITTRKPDMIRKIMSE